MAWFGSKGKKPADEASSGPPAKPNDTPSSSPRKGRRRRWLVFLHVALVVLVLAGLAFLNWAWDLDRLLSARWETVRAIWLPLVFLLGYLLCLVCWWAVRQLGPDRLTGEFPDLDKAWAQGRELLAEGGIDLRTTPLFLVLGEPEGGIELLFAASRWPFQVRLAAPGSEAPLHVYANREAIFVACGSASLLAHATRSRVAARQADTPLAAGPCLASDRPQPSPAEAIESASALPENEAASSKLEAQQEKASPKVSLVGEDTCAIPSSPATLWPTQNRPLAERLSARLACLCRHIAHDRQPLVPLNGVLALFPLSATDSADCARATALACRSDLQTVRESVGVECPHVALLCDLHQLPGFDELVTLFSDSPARQWVLGRTFPLLPDVEPGRWPAMIEQGLRWLTDSLWPSAIYPSMEAGLADWKPGDAIVKANQRRFRLLAEVSSRMRLVPEMIAHCFQATAPARPLFRGFAMAATGTDSLREQGFAAGALRWLVEAQDYVRWTEETLREDTLYRRWALWGSLGLASFLALVVFLCVGLVR